MIVNAAMEKTVAGSKTTMANAPVVEVAVTRLRFAHTNRAASHSTQTARATSATGNALKTTFETTSM